MNRVRNILGKNGPLLSGKIAEKLVQEYKMSPVAARKAISRIKPPIHRLNLINFENNQKFYYLDYQFNKELFLNTLLLEMKQQSKAYYSVIQALYLHNGYIDKDQLTAYTSLPLKPLTGHRLASRVIEDLQTMLVIQEYNDNTWQINPKLGGLNYARYRAIELAKKITMNHFCEWAKSLNLIAYNSDKVLTEEPEFFKFQWGFTAPSYISGIGKRRDGKPSCFVIADILMGKTLDESAVAYFMTKIKILRQQKKIASFIPLIITDSPIARSVFQAFKMEGIVIASVDTLFGAKYLEALQSLVHVIEHASAIVSSNSDEYFKLMDQLSELEGKSANLRGDLFELAVGYYYSKRSQYIEINKNILEHKSGKRKEIDVFVKCSNNEIRVIECKGHKYPLDMDKTKKWINDNVPTIRAWLLSQDEYANKHHTFELWSTGGFEEEALAVLKKYSDEVKIYKVVYYDKAGMEQLVKESDDSNLQKIINKYY